MADPANQLILGLEVSHNQHIGQQQSLLDDLVIGKKRLVRHCPWGAEGTSRRQLDNRERLSFGQSKAESEIVSRV